MFYVTRPGVPIVLTLCRFTEKSGCRRKFEIEMSAFPCPSGDKCAATQALVDKPSGQVKIYSGERGSGSASEQWIAVYDPATMKTLGTVCLNGNAYLWDAADSGKAVWVDSKIHTIPGKTVESAVLYAIADNPDLIAPLARIIPPPIRTASVASGHSPPHPRLAFRSTSVSECDHYSPHI